MAVMIPELDARLYNSTRAVPEDEIDSFIEVRFQSEEQ